MVLVYVNLIMKGLWELENVPDVWRADVEIKLAELKLKPQPEEKSEG